jgi:hypothetical protein
MLTIFHNSNGITVTVWEPDADDDDTCIFSKLIYENENDSTETTIIFETEKYSLIGNDINYDI